MADHIKIRPADGTWSIRAGGAVLGETSTALELSEGTSEPVIYVPREDLAMAFLEKTDHVTTSPHKGEATHYSIVTKSTVLENAAWSYEDPQPGVEQIRGHIAFYPLDTVTVEMI